MATTEEYDYLYKIILVGDATVGKTHLVSRYVRGTLPKAPQSTIGVEYSSQVVHLATGGSVKAQIWDTAGQERYRSITSAHYRRAVGALLVYDITQKQTFSNVSQWLSDLRQNGEPNIVVLLVGNKVDLVEDNEDIRQVPYETAEKFAADNDILFAEASAVSAYNVRHIFQLLLQEIYDVRSKEYPDLHNKDELGGLQLSSTSSLNSKNLKNRDSSEHQYLSLLNLFKCCFPQ